MLEQALPWQGYCALPKGNRQISQYDGDATSSSKSRIFLNSSLLDKFLKIQSFNLGMLKQCIQPHKMVRLSSWASQSVKIMAGTTV